MQHASLDARICRALLRRRKTVLAGAAVVGGLALTCVLQIRFEFSFTQFFPSADHAPVARYLDYIKRFGRDDTFALVALAPRQGNLYTPEHLDRLALVSRRLAALDGIERVDGLSTARLPAAAAETLHAVPLYSTDDGVDPVEIDRIRKAADSSPFVRAQLISADGRAALIVARLRASTEVLHNRASDDEKVLDQIRAVVDTELPGTKYEVHFTGVPFVRAGYIALLEQETWQLAAASAFILALVLFGLFRSLRAVVLPMVVVGLSTVLSVAALVLGDHGFTLMSTLIPIVVLVIGVADSVHFMARFQEERQRGRTVEDALVAAYHHLAIACLLTSVTTAVGFLGLTVSAIGMLADFGLYTALGVMLAYVATVVVLPPLLVTFPLRRLPPRRRSPRPLHRYLAFHHWLAVTCSHTVVVTVGLLAVGLSLWAGNTLRQDAHFVDDLDAGHPMVAASRFVEDNFNGFLPLEILLEGEPGQAFAPTTVAASLAASELLRGEPHLGSVHGYGEVVQLIASAVAGAEVDLASPAAVAQVLLLAEGADSELLERFVGPDAASVRIAARADDIGTLAMRPLLERLADRLADLERRFPDLRCRLAGFTPAAVWVSDYMVKQLFGGAVAVILLITVMMGLLFRSVRAALVTLPCNLLPLVGVMAWMGLTGVEIKPTTAIIFSVAFGLSVDNTIHLLARYRSELSRRHNSRRALARTLTGTGRGIVMASLVLSLGFSGALFAELGTTFQFAALAIVTIVGAAVTALLLLPALLMWRLDVPLPRPSPPPRSRCRRG